MKEGAKILIAYDGSDCSDSALDDLTRAGLPKEAEVLVLSVAEVWMPPPPPVEKVEETARNLHSAAELQKRYVKGSKAIIEAEELAQRAGKRVEFNFPKWTIKTEATFGSPSWEIISKADEWKPDLILVGSHGRSALSRLALGSVSQKVLTEAHCSVRVARGSGMIGDSPVRILIGIDGSDASMAAVEEVASRHWPEGSSVKVVAVDEPITPTIVGQIIPPVVEWTEEVNQTHRERLSKVLVESVNKLQSVGLEASSVICDDNPKKELVRQAERWDAECIFVGSVGFHNVLERFLLGSVSAAIAARAHCSVEIVRLMKEHLLKQN